MTPSLRVIEDDVFADLDAINVPRGEARLVYADPPYTKEDYFGYGVAPDWGELADRMHELGADDAIYVMHIGSAGLAELLPVLEERAPKRRRRHSGGRVRVLSWVKEWGAWRPNTTFQWSWEPILVWYGKGYRVPARSGLAASTDWLMCAPQKSVYGHPTEKPPRLIRWLFDALLSNARDRLAIDLYAGTGTAALMTLEYGMWPIAVERGERWAQVIRDRRDQDIVMPRLSTLESLGVQESLDGLDGGSPFQRRYSHPPSGRRRAHLGRADDARKAANA